MQLFMQYSYGEIFPFQTSFIPTLLPPLPLPIPLSQHTTAPPSLATSAMEPLAPNAGTTSWKSAPATRIISPGKTTLLLCLSFLPSPSVAIPSTNPSPLATPPLVKRADLLTARLDTRMLVDNRSQTRRASVSISPAEIASPSMASPGSTDLFDWTTVFHTGPAGPAILDQGLTPHYAIHYLPQFFFFFPLKKSGLTSS